MYLCKFSFISHIFHTINITILKEIDSIFSKDTKKEEPPKRWVTSFSGLANKGRLKVSCNKEFLMLFGRMKGDCWEFDVRDLDNPKYVQHSKGVNKNNYKEYIKNIGNISIKYIIKDNLEYVNEEV